MAYLAKLKTKIASLFQRTEEIPVRRRFRYPTTDEAITTHDFDLTLHCARCGIFREYVLLDGIGCYVESGTVAKNP